MTEQRKIEMAETSDADEQTPLVIEAAHRLVFATGVAAHQSGLGRIDAASVLLTVAIDELLCVAGPIATLKTLRSVLEVIESRASEIRPLSPAGRA